MTSVDRPGAVAETSTSYVFFTSDLALKMKKPVTLPFLDFSTIAARRVACEREVALNRRLAPDVYKGTAALIGDDGEVIDHFVVMERLPADRRLAVLATADAPGVRDEVECLAARLATFHRYAERSTRIAAEATTASVRRRWEANSEELAALVDDPFDLALVAEINSLAARYLAGREALFAQRIATGRAVDGHGDLLADDVFCLEKGPRVLDCLDFSDDLRYGDGLADVAFLAMDLERLGRPDLAAAFLSSYADAAQDQWPQSLAHHYVAYRAQVRAKVAAIRGDIDEMRQLLHLAQNHLHRGTTRVVLVGGSPGTGKSRLAVGLAGKRGWTVLRSDAVRKELAGMPFDAPAPSGLREGLYRPEFTAQNYRELLRRAAELLARGESVILDATWSSATARAEARRVAEGLCADIVELRCDAPVAVATSRAAERARKGGDLSDADAHIAAALFRAADDWPEATTVDTTGSRRASVCAALGAIDCTTTAGQPDPPALARTS